MTFNVLPTTASGVECNQCDDTRVGINDTTNELGNGMAQGLRPGTDNMCIHVWVGVTVLPITTIGMGFVCWY